MNDIGSERSKPWMYTNSNSNPSGAVSFRTSMNAISFGFVATAILISMFLLMALFEHIFRPSATLASPSDAARNSLQQQPAAPFDKLACQPQPVATAYASDFSVVMPGHSYPTYIAQPAPQPCIREGTYWPSHEHNLVIP